MFDLTKLIDPISTLLDKVVPDAGERAKLAHEIATLAERQAHEQAKWQAEINKKEASHSSLFVAGWRPAMGWVCVLGFGVQFLIGPLVAPFVIIPVIDVGHMSTILLGMLGLGGLRSYEKSKGVAREQLQDKRI